MADNTHAAETDELLAKLKEAVDLGTRQAAEMDRFWEAIGMASEDTTVDDAIAKWRQMEKENSELREKAKAVCDAFPDTDDIFNFCDAECRSQDTGEGEDCDCEKGVQRGAVTVLRAFLSA